MVLTVELDRLAEGLISPGEADVAVYLNLAIQGIHTLLLAVFKKKKREGLLDDFASHL